MWLLSRKAAQPYYIIPETCSIQQLFCAFQDFKKDKISQKHLLSYVRVHVSYRYRYQRYQLQSDWGESIGQLLSSLMAEGKNESEVFTLQTPLLPLPEGRSVNRMEAALLWTLR